MIATSPRPRRTGSRLAVVISVLVAASLSACTGGGGGVPTPAPSVGGAVSDVNAHDRAELQTGGTVRQAVSSIKGPWNPLSTAGDSADLDRMREPLLPRFFDYDATGAPTPDPDFLVSATQTATSPTTIVYELNPKAVWGDGSPIDGDDMVATWQACNGSDPAFSCARTDAFSQVASVVPGTDKFSVTVTFKGVYPDWTSVFDRPGVLKAESVADPTTFNDGWNRLDNDWLAGPFRYDTSSVASGVLTEVPNEKWWGDAPLLSQLLWRVVAPTDRAAAYTAHRLDAYTLDPTTYAQVAAWPGTVVRQAPGTTVRQLLLATTTGPLADPAVRRSVARAIDRTALQAVDLDGTGLPTTTFGSHVFVPGQLGYADNSGSLAFDPTAAQADLDAAGWVRAADGFRAKDGTTLEVPVLVSSSDPTGLAEARLISTQLDAIGVKAEVTSLPASAARAALRAQDFQLAAVARTVSDPPYAALDGFVSDATANVGGFTSPEYDALVRQISTEADPTQRAALANQADVLLWSAAVALPLYQRPDLVATVPTLANFGAFGLASTSYEDVGYLR